MQRIFCLLFLFWTVLGQCSGESSITYTFSGGRFGDNLLAYLHAKWVSYRYDIPLLYKSFPYSDQLVLDDLEARFINKNKFRKVIELGGKLKEPRRKNKSSVLYVLPYFPETLYERGDGYAYIAVDWKDPGFRTILKNLVRSKNPIPQRELPTDRVTVAAHLRRGGTNSPDDPNMGNRDPLKAPSDQFFIDQIRYISDFFQKPLYVFLFTDDSNPEAFAKQYAQALSDLDIAFDYRKEGNHHNANVLEDFFAMAQFDCLIRGESNYSITCAKIADFQLEIYPQHFFWHNQYPVYDQIKVEVRNE
jgi:hypothetical protein